LEGIPWFAWAIPAGALVISLATFLFSAISTRRVSDEKADTTWVARLRDQIDMLDRHSVRDAERIQNLEKEALTTRQQLADCERRNILLMERLFKVEDEASR
jgi:hypothetical protein